MYLLSGVVKDNAWGSTTAIPELLGVAPTGEPQAELWLGAHPRGPAQVHTHDGVVGLDQMIAADPVAALGPAVARAFEGSLPFLLKILAADSPLSIQAHPTIGQAVAGFERENAAGVAVDAANRSFRDRNHKPELICALSPFTALCGLRHPADTAELLAGVAPTELAPVVAALRDAASSTPSEATKPSPLSGVLELLLTASPDQQADWSKAAHAGCAADWGPERFSAERTQAARLGDAYPGDIGVVVALLLNLVELAPGEALFLGAGNLHAYLHGTGVEVMANSDNVVRGGLTPKHIDLPVLLEVVDATPMEPDVQRPTAADGRAEYRCPVPEFSLTRLDIDAEDPDDDKAGGHVTIAGGSPTIVLCTAGRLTATSGDTTIALRSGAALWQPAHGDPITVVGTGRVFTVQPAGGTGLGVS